MPSPASLQAGGGANCNVTGNLAGGGVPNGIAGFDYSCTHISNPDAGLAHRNRSSYTLARWLFDKTRRPPLMVPGYVSGGLRSGGLPTRRRKPLWTGLIHSTGPTSSTSKTQAGHQSARGPQQCHKGGKEPGSKRKQEPVPAVPHLASSSRHSPTQTFKCTYTKKVRHLTLSGREQEGIDDEFKVINQFKLNGVRQRLIKELIND